MIICNLTEDASLIKKIGSDPRVWNSLSDDFSCEREKWNPIITSTMCCVEVNDTTTSLGVVVFIQQSCVIWEIHPLLFPETYWQGKAKEATLEAMKWFLEHFPNCHRLVGYVAVLNHKTKMKFPLELGMDQYGLNSKAFMKNGKLVDLAEFGISRSKVCQ